MELFTRMFRSKVAQDDSRQSAVLTETPTTTLPRRVVVESPDKRKAVDLWKWPTFEDCVAAEGTNEPVVFQVNFTGEEHDEVDIQVYVELCYSGTESCLVEGTTGPDHSVLTIEVHYDAEQPRRIHYTGIVE